MTLETCFRSLASGCLAAILGTALLGNPLSAQTHYETGGRANQPDPFETDGFKPVWQQQQEEAARRAKAAAAAAAKAKQDALRKMAEAKKAKGKQEPTPEPAAETQPVRTETTQFDQWAVTCREVVGGKTPKTCTAALRVVQPNQQLILLWEIGRGNDGVVRSVIQTPTGVFVQKGVDLKIGDAVVGKLDYVACVPQNCEASGPLDTALVNKLAAAGEATVTIHARDGRDVHFKFPVKGIDKAVAALSS
jgi:invasion protein IalB